MIRVFPEPDLLLPTDLDPASHCIACFRSYSNDSVAPCSTCGLTLHSDCRNALGGWADFRCTASDQACRALVRVAQIQSVIDADRQTSALAYTQFGGLIFIGKAIEAWRGYRRLRAIPVESYAIDRALLTDFVAGAVISIPVSFPMPTDKLPTPTRFTALWAMYAAIGVVLGLLFFWGVQSKPDRIFGFLFNFCLVMGQMGALMFVVANFPGKALETESLGYLQRIGRPMMYWKATLPGSVSQSAISPRRA